MVYSNLVLPLTDLLTEECSWPWSLAYQVAFERVNTFLSCAPALRLSSSAPGAPLYIAVPHASLDGLGVVLLQDVATRGI